MGKFGDFIGFCTCEWYNARSKVKVYGRLPAGIAGSNLL